MGYLLFASECGRVKKENRIFAFVTNKKKRFEENFTLIANALNIQLKLTKCFNAISGEVEGGGDMYVYVKRNKITDSISINKTC